MFFWLSDVLSYDGEVEFLPIILTFQSINDNAGPFAIKRCQISKQLIQLAIWHFLLAMLKYLWRLSSL